MPQARPGAQAGTSTSEGVSKREMGGGGGDDVCVDDGGEKAPI